MIEVVGEGGGNGFENGRDYLEGRDELVDKKVLLLSVGLALGVSACIGDCSNKDESQVPAALVQVESESSESEEEVDDSLPVALDLAQTGPMCTEDETLVSLGFDYDQDDGFTNPFYFQMEMCTAEGMTFFEFGDDMTRLIFTPMRDGQVDTTDADYMIGFIDRVNLTEVSLDDGPWHVMNQENFADGFCHTLGMFGNSNSPGVTHFQECEDGLVTSLGIPYVRIGYSDAYQAENEEETVTVTGEEKIYNVYITYMRGVSYVDGVWVLGFTERDMILRGGYDGSMIRNTLNTFRFFVEENVGMEGEGMEGGGK